VCHDIENNACTEQDKLSAGDPQLAKGTPMSQRTAHRRHQALDHSLANDKVKDICRHLACSKSWLYKWRNRYDAANPAWVQERSTRPKHSPTQTPGHVARALVSLHETLRQNGTGGGVTAMMQALAQQGIEPVPSRRTLSRIVRHHDTEVKQRGSHPSISSEL
jgi:transposase-like protein